MTTGRLSEPRSVTDTVKEGTRVANVIALDAGVDKIDMFTGLAVYCSMLSSESVPVGEEMVKVFEQTLKGAVISTNGLSVNGKLYPYKPEYQQLIHNAILQEIARESRIPEAMLSYLSGLHETWCSYYMEKRGGFYVKELKGIYDEKARQLRKEAEKPFLGNNKRKFRRKFLQESYSDFTSEQFESLWVDVCKYNIEISDLRTESNVAFRKEIHRLKSIGRVSSEVESATKNIYMEEFDRKSNEASLTFDSYVKETYGIDFHSKKFEQEVGRRFEEAFEEYFSTYTSLTSEDYHIYKSFRILYKKLESHLREMMKAARIANDELPESVRSSKSFNLDIIQRALTETRVAIKKECGERYYLGFRGAEYMKVPEHFYEMNGKNPVRKRVDVAKEGLYAVCAEYFKDSKDIYEPILSEYISLCERYYGNILVKHREARVTWGCMPDGVRHKLSQETAQIYAECESLKDTWVRDRIYEELEGLFQKITEHLLGRVPDSGRMLMLPTGVLLSVDGNTSVRGLSPLDAVFKSCLDDEQWGRWLSSWAEFYKKKITKFNLSAYRAINDFVSGELKSGRLELKEDERRIVELCEKYGLDIPPFLNVKTGVILPVISEPSVYSLEVVLERFGRYIDGIVFESHDRLDSIESYSKSLKSHLSGVSGRAKTVFFSYASKITVDLYGLTCLGVSDTVLSLVSVDLATLLFSKLSRDVLDEYAGLVGERVEVTKSDFFGLYGRRVDSHVERRNLMLMTLFVSDFNGFITGKSTGDTHEFFENRIHFSRS